MRPAFLPGRRRAQRGIVAIEVTALCTMLFWLALWTLVFGRLIFQYNELRIATGQAARYLSVAPVTDARITVARQMVMDAAAEAGLSGVTVKIDCLPWLDCFDPTSTSVQLVTKAPVLDPTYMFAPDGLNVRAVAVAGYYQESNK